MIIATAGHIDHGKTTLVKALTGVDTDRLPEEKARGISIDLGFAYWKSDAGTSIGFVDVPGHERFIRNMLAGVCGIDYVMLVVAADDGVMPQTIEHLNIVDLLQVARGVAVITKADRSSPSRLAQVAEDIRSLLAATRLAAIPIMPVSAPSGEGIAELRHELAAAARALDHRASSGRHFRYAIDRAFTVAGSGTVVTGTVFDGAVAVGDKLVLSPTGLEVRVRALEQQGHAAQRAVAGERCALNLTGADLAQVGRGDWLVAPVLHAPTRRIAVRLRLMPGEAQPLKHWTPIHLHLGTADVTGRVAIRRGEAIAPGAEAVIQLILDRPLASLNGDRFIVRDQSATRTLGGGTVIDPFAPATRRNSAERRAQLAALEHTAPEVALAGLAACSAAGVELAQFERTCNLKAELVVDLARQLGLVVVGRDPRVALPQPVVDAIEHGLLAALRRFHGESPQAAGAEIEVQRKALAAALAAATFLALLREFAERGKIELTGSLVRLPGHITTANPADEKLWTAIRPLLETAAFKVPTLRELTASTRLKEALLKDFLFRKSRTGELLHVGAERFYPRATLAQLAALAQAICAASGGQFTVAQFRDASGVGRGLATEILECLDQLRVTQRVGDIRKMRGDSVAILGAANAPMVPAAQATATAEPQRRVSPRPGRDCGR